MKMDFNTEAVLFELNDFEKTNQDIVPPILDDYLKKIAQTGDILFPWNKLKPLVRRKMEMVVADFHDNCPAASIPSLPNTDVFDYEVVKTNLLKAVDVFASAPFTIQRLCELITSPKKHYNRTDKYMRGLEKNLLVVSTVEPNSNDASNRSMIVNGTLNSSIDPLISEHHEPRGHDIIVSFPSNGPKLENFETVFHPANRIPPPAIPHQVAVISGSSGYNPSADLDNCDFGLNQSTGIMEGEEIKSTEASFKDKDDCLETDQPSTSAITLEVGKEACAISGSPTEVMEETTSSDFDLEMGKLLVNSVPPISDYPNKLESTISEKSDLPVEEVIGSIDIDVSISDVKEHVLQDPAVELCEAIENPVVDEDLSKIVGTPATQETSFTINPTTQTVELKPEEIGPTPQIIDLKPEIIDPIPEVVDFKPEIIDTKAQIMDLKPELEITDPEPKVIDPTPEAMEPEPEIINSEPEIIHPESEIIGTIPDVIASKPDIISGEPEAKRPKLDTASLGEVENIVEEAGNPEIRRKCPKAPPSADVDSVELPECPASLDVVSETCKSDISPDGEQ